VSALCEAVLPQVAEAFAGPASALERKLAERVGQYISEKNAERVAKGVVDVLPDKLIDDVKDGILEAADIAVKEGRPCGNQAASVNALDFLH
jgi:hypothetical protein